MREYVYDIVERRVSAALECLGEPVRVMVDPRDWTLEIA